MAKQKNDSYERVEITFSKDNELEMDLYNFLLKKSKLLGKAKYIKTLILNEKEATTEK